MFNKKIFQSVSCGPLLQCIAYPMGVVLVFVCIIGTTIVSYQFFARMIRRATTLPSSAVSAGATFQLEAYETLQSRFAFLAPQPATSRVTAPVTTAILIRGATTASERLSVVSGLLRAAGWTSVGTEEGGSEGLRTVVTSTARAKNALNAVRDTLTKGGFVVVEGTSLSEDAKTDILIEVGTY